MCREGRGKRKRGEREMACPVMNGCRQGEGTRRGKNIFFYPQQRRQHEDKNIEEVAEEVKGVRDKIAVMVMMVVCR